MKVSLKIKILLGVSILLIICTGFNLGYSYKLFVEDKISYIFESGSRKAVSISDQINFKINDLIIKSEINYILLNNPSVAFDKIIDKQQEVVAAGFFSSAKGEELKLRSINHNTDNMKLFTDRLVDFEIVTKEIIKNSKDPLLSNKSKTWVFSPARGLHFLIYISKRLDINSLSGKAENENLFFLISDISPLFELISNDPPYANSIVLLDNANDRKNYKDQISKLNYKKGRRGAVEMVVAGKEILLSYSFVNNNIVVLSSIDKSEAFKVINILLVKTGWFGVFLLGIGLVAGIYFSSSITYPIIVLTDKAKKIAEGDFSSDVQIETSDEIKLLGDTFNFMSYEIKALLSNKEELIAKLENYSKNLEKMVEQRTIELKEANDFMALMMNSLDQGFLVFDNELNCNPMFTKACLPIFGMSPLEKSVLDILNITDENYATNLKQWAKVLFSEMIPFESAIDLGPREKVTGKTYLDENYKFVHMDYYAMRDSEDKISNVVLIATDKTVEVQAKEIAKEKEAYVHMILKILNNKTQFESFVNEVEGIFRQFNKAYSTEDGIIDFNLCMMLFHTLNGGFGIYYINKIQQIARGYESGISNMKDSIPDPLKYIPILESQVENLKNEFMNFRMELDSLVGTKFASNQSLCEIPRYKILEFKKLVAQSTNLNLRNYFNDNFLKVPIIDYFRAYDELCITTAAKINKEFAGLIFHNAELKIEAESLLEFFNVLVHLFRNCLDHGLEEASQRLSLGKTSEGHIAVSFKEIETFDEKFLSVVIQDDGAGINPEVIRARCAKLNPSEDISKLSDREVIYQIFAPFFSTRDEVSALSGRGVGMSAIKEVVDRLNGKIEIKSKVGVGTVFAFTVPIK